jgi:hypothetical protein
MQKFMNLILANRETKLFCGGAGQEFATTARRANHLTKKQREVAAAPRFLVLPLRVAPTIDSARRLAGIAARHAGELALEGGHRIVRWAKALFAPCPPFIRQTNHERRAHHRPDPQEATHARQDASRDCLEGSKHLNCTISSSQMIDLIDREGARSIGKNEREKENAAFGSTIFAHNRLYHERIWWARRRCAFAHPKAAAPSSARRRFAFRVLAACDTGLESGIDDRKLHRLGSMIFPPKSADTHSRDLPGTSPGFPSPRPRRICGRAGFATD